MVRKEDILVLKAIRSRYIYGRLKPKYKEQIGKTQLILDR
jgi:hypothetical protein